MKEEGEKEVRRDERDSNQLSHEPHDLLSAAPRRLPTRTGVAYVVQHRNARPFDDEIAPTFKPQPAPPRRSESDDLAHDDGVEVLRLEVPPRHTRRRRAELREERERASLDVKCRLGARVGMPVHPHDINNANRRKINSNVLNVKREG